MALALFWAAPVAAQKTDVVVLINGDRITCEVKQLTRGRLEVKRTMSARCRSSGPRSPPSRRRSCSST
jgi:hypothetical protein